MLFHTPGRLDSNDKTTTFNVMEAMAAAMYDQASTKDPVSKRFRGLGLRA